MTKTKVKAIAPCFVNGRLQGIGDVFEIVPDLFSEHCMEKVSTTGGKTAAKKKRKKKEPVDGA